MKASTDAGSRMHVLDWAERRPELIAALNRMCAGTGAVVESDCFYMPQSRTSHREAFLTKLV